MKHPVLIVKIKTNFSHVDQGKKQKSIHNKRGLEKKRDFIDFDSETNSLTDHLVEEYKSTELGCTFTALRVLSVIRPLGIVDA